MATWKMRSGLWAGAAVSLASITSAQITQHCPSSNICYSLSIPQTTSDSGSGPIYFQVSAPTSYEWVALGQGSGMAGANIFVVYTDSTGSNVTVSPRLGTGHVQPQHDTAAQIEVLEGSGVSNGVMTANVRCSNCDSWSGGSMDFSSSSDSWIYAWTSGSSLDTDQLNANINRHEQASSFNFDFTAARSAENVNPFVSSTGTAAGSGSGTTNSGSVPASCTPIAASQSGSTASSTGSSNSASSTSSNSSSGSSDGAGRPNWSHNNDGADRRPPWWNDANNDNNSKLRRRQSSTACPAGHAPVSAAGGSSGQSSGSTPDTIVMAHAVLACIAFVALFPSGGILIRVASFPSLVWVHAALQMLAYVIYIVAFGIGVWMATNMGYLSSAHPIIGIILFVVLFGQPLLGLLHHKLFQKYHHRTLWSYAHIGIGRIAILLGIINGGLGLQLAESHGGSVIAYGVVAGVMGLAYLGAIIFGETKRRRAAARGGDMASKGQGERPSRHSSREEQEYYGPGRA